MQTKKLYILGKSEATLTMILDNLESNNYFPEIIVINNMDLPFTKSFENLKFDLTIVKDILPNDSDYEVFLGGFQVGAKVGIFDNFKFLKRDFINIFHANTSVSSTSNFGSGCLINSLVSVAAYTTLGDFVSVNRNCSIGHHTLINDFVSINPGSNIAGNVIIGEKTQIGMGTNIVDGISIGKNTIIGAGSLVTRDIPDNVLAYGVPAKIIKEI